MQASTPRSLSGVQNIGAEAAGMRRLRVLALHSFRTSGKIFSEQARSIMAGALAACPPMLVQH